MSEYRGVGAFYDSLQLVGVSQEIREVTLEAWAIKTTSPWVPISQLKHDFKGAKKKE